MRPLAKITCCAFDEKNLDSDNKYVTKYHIDFDGPSISQIVRTRGYLTSIEDITEEEYSGWKISNREEFLKKLDYDAIEMALNYLGKSVNMLADLTRKDFYFSNNNYHFKNLGARKLKPFEMKILLDSYKTNNKSQH